MDQNAWLGVEDEDEDEEPVFSQRLNACVW
jgi:hypothetical protein